MFGQLNNLLHYKPLQLDPTAKHLALVDGWCSKWLGKGEISPEIAKWVLNKEAKPGVAFGNIKTHKAVQTFNHSVTLPYHPCKRQALGGLK